MQDWVHVYLDARRSLPSYKRRAMCAEFAKNHERSSTGPHAMHDKFQFKLLMSRGGRQRLNPHKRRYKKKMTTNLRNSTKCFHVSRNVKAMTVIL